MTDRVPVDRDPVQSPPAVRPSAPTGAATLVGYAAGVFDLFHLGHLNLLRQARERCGFLIAAVSSDELATELRGQAPVMPQLERMAIVQSVRHVDLVVPQVTVDRMQAWETLRFDVLFAGDNLRGTRRWVETEERMADVGVRVEYLPATHRRSGELLERGPRDLVAD